jgi:hypothetical protein
MIQKNCAGGGMKGRAASFVAGLGKECADVRACVESFFTDRAACGSAGQPSDFWDNAKGWTCKRDQSCLDQCSYLIGKKDASKGPFVLPIGF